MASQIEDQSGGFKGLRLRIRKMACVLPEIPPAIQKLILFEFAVCGFLLSTVQFMYLSSDSANKVSHTFADLYQNFLYGRVWGTVYFIIGIVYAAVHKLPYFLTISVTCRWNTYIENRTKRTLFQVVTFLLCEIYTVVEVKRKLQVILSDVGASFGQSSFYWIEIFFAVSIIIMAINVQNHIVLIYYTFNAIEPKESLFLTRWNLLLCVLQIIAFIGIELFLVLWNCSEDWHNFLLLIYFQSFIFFGANFMKEIPYLDMGKFEFESSRSSETNEFIVLVFCNLSAFIFFSLIFKSIVFPYYDDYDVTIEFPMRYYAYNVSSFVFILCQVVCVYFVVQCDLNCTIDEEYVCPDIENFDEDDETAEAGWVIVDSATM